MTVVETILPASPQVAFSVLEDPRALRMLVLGARRIRRFEPHWPSPGSAVHHSVGFFPLVVRDTTVVLDCEQDRHLLLEARVSLIGAFHVDFRLDPQPDGTTRLTIGEQVIRGPMSLPFVRPLVDLAVKLRNVELGRRYRHLVEQRLAVTESSRA